MLNNGRTDILRTRYERLVSMGAARLPHNFTHVFEHRTAAATAGGLDSRLREL